MRQALRERLEEVEQSFVDLEHTLADAEVIADQTRYTELTKRHAELGEIVQAYRGYREVVGDLEAAHEMLAETGGDGAPALAEEAEELERRRDALEARLARLVIPSDPHDERDVIVEVRAAAGGDEAGLFAGELRDMYLSYAASRGWETAVLSESRQGVGGVKESVVEVTGRGAYARLKHESGVHRVQRVPATESSGRVHTSTASVAVLPAAEEVEVDLDPADVETETFRSSGPGGQSVNTTDSAVRVTHRPTGISVSCQDNKSQHQNRDKAMQILRSRLLQAEQEARGRQRAEYRRGQIGTGDRSEKIRTYNFPQHRVTDHRIDLTVHNLDDVLSGELDELLDALREAEQEALLEEELAADTPAGEQELAGSQGQPA